MRKVSDQENMQANGMPLCDVWFWDSFQAKVSKLRQRQAGYLASLPQDESGAIEAALTKLAPDCDPLPVGFERAQHLSQALEVILREGETMKSEDPVLEAALWMAGQVAQDLRDVREVLEGCIDMLRNPARCSRGARPVVGRPNDSE